MKKKTKYLSPMNEHEENSPGPLYGHPKINFGKENYAYCSLHLVQDTLHRSIVSRTREENNCSIIL
uniref:Uncharacterized protein n=2 Tax=Arundo donax TaxID=35708 RepID=A0A0A9ANR9_ARUDO